MIRIGINQHRSYELIWNPMSWNPSPKEGVLLANVVPKHEYRNYVDPLATIPMEAI